MFKIFCKSDIGRVRKMNQDFVVYKIFGEDKFFAGVFDGIGGTNGGEVASKTAAETIIEYVSKHFNRKDVLAESLEIANKKILEIGINRNIQKPGTTAALVFVDGNRCLTAHVGDSRIYFWNSGKFSQITRDHSMVCEMGLSEDEIKNHPQKNIITRALGMEELNAEFNEFSFKKYGKLLMCTDGLTNYTQNCELEKILEEKDGIELVEFLINLANEAGGEDNVTVLIAQNIE
jgi:protein phosphatase